MRDGDRLSGYGNTIQAWCLTLGNGRDNMDDELLISQSMLLVRSQNSPGSYRRVGFIEGGPEGAPPW